MIKWAITAGLIESFINFPKGLSISWFSFEVTMMEVSFFLLIRALIVLLSIDNDFTPSLSLNSWSSLSKYLQIKKQDLKEDSYLPTFSQTVSGGVRIQIQVHLTYKEPHRFHLDPQWHWVSYICYMFFGVQGIHIHEKEDGTLKKVSYHKVE